MEDPTNRPAGGQTEARADLETGTESVTLPVNLLKPGTSRSVMGPGRFGPGQGS
jgi:hypothetical protein